MREPRSCSSAAPWAPSSEPELTPDDAIFFAAVSIPGESGDEWKAFGRVSTFDDPSTRWPDFKPGVRPARDRGDHGGAAADRRLIHRLSGRRGARRRAGPPRRSGADPRRDLIGSALRSVEGRRRGRGAPSPPAGPARASDGGPHFWDPSDALTLNSASFWRETAGSLFRTCAGPPTRRSRSAASSPASSSSRSRASGPIG